MMKSDNAQKRKAIEKAVYNHSHKPNQKRATFGSYFEPHSNKLLFEYEFNPDLYKRLKKYATNKSVLVLGAGATDVGDVLQVTEKVEAIDISEKMVEAINKRYPKVKAFVGDAENLHQLKKKYDVIYCRSILHHLHPFEKIIKDIHSILKDDGVMLVASEPGLLNPSAALGRLIAPSKEHTPGERPYVYYQYHRVIQDYFEIVESKYYFLFSNTLPVLAQKIPALQFLVRRSLIPLLKLERILTKLPFLSEFYWITSGVYRKKKLKN